MIIFFIYQGTSSHTEMTLSGRGIKHMESYNTHGDHIVHIMIKMPVNMTEEQKELIKEYAYLETDTPGTVNGIDKSSWVRGFRKRDVEKEEEEYYKQQKQEEREQSERDDMPSQDDKRSDSKGTIAKIVDAISENETVKYIKKKIFG